MEERTAIQDWIYSLKELDCGKEWTAQVVEAVGTHRTDLASELLRRQKRILLEQLHESERRVDLADFLLYRLKKGFPEENM